MSRIAIILCSVLLGGLFVPAADANHPQSGATFDSLGGNEWWVEVQLGGRYAEWWTPPEVRDTNGEWASMTRPSWAPNPGFYALSYRVEPGHQVQFRLQYPKSSSYLLSCWFSHPGGVEACDGRETFSVAWNPRGDGDEVHVRPASTQRIESVEVRVAGEPWGKSLARQPDGAWSMWTEIPRDTILEFTARSADSGDYVSGPCYRWWDVVQVPCPSPYQVSVFNPHPEGGDWSRLNATLSYAVSPSRVDVRFDGGEWRPMTRSGDYVHYDGAPTGSSQITEFRAIAPDGRVSCDDEAYWYPYGTSYPPQVGGHRDVLFTHMTGNEHWVQVSAYAMTPIVTVEAQVNGGPWTKLPRQSYCDHAASVSAPAGSAVRFRAMFPDFTFDVSDHVTWPPGTPTQPFAATFEASGDQNLIRVKVNATRPVSFVEFLVDNHYGGRLTKQADGSWARVGYVPEGMVITFAAWGPTASDVAHSGCFRWTSATPIACPDEYWAWVQNVHAYENQLRTEVGNSNDPEPARVQARIDGGDFRDMSKSTETWQYYYLDGMPTSGDHLVQFRLEGPDGQVACAPRGYHWPFRGEDPYYGLHGGMRFENVKGHENWVQVNVYASDVVAVEAQVNGGAWQALTMQPFCDWAKAISAPAGSTVRFRAFWPNLTHAVSPAFAWPPGSTPPSGFDATFRDVKGNEWWLQAGVSATGGTLAKVEVSLNGGAWKPLANKGWGWAASYHAPQGTLVQFRATSTTGATDLSGCYTWTAATPVACPGGGGGTPPPPPGGFDATFSNARGNNWWVEVDVSASGGTLAGVDARVNGGAWTALTKQSWGSWAKSIHAPTGSTVEFRARAADGATDVSAAYKWPPA